MVIELPRKRMRNGSTRVASEGSRDPASSPGDWPTRERDQKEQRWCESSGTSNGGADIPEDVALAVLLHSVSSRIDPTGELYMKLCSSFKLSSTTTLEVEANRCCISPLNSGCSTPSSPAGSDGFSQCHDVRRDSGVGGFTGGVREQSEVDEEATTESSIKSQPSSLKWGVESPSSTPRGVSRIDTASLRDAPLSDLLEHLKTLGLQDLVRSIHERVISTIPTALTTPRFRPVNWKLGRVLGEGTFGECRMALDEASGALFAVKAVPMGGPASSVAATVRSVQRELEVLRGVSHPHIVHMYAVSCVAATSTPAALCDVSVGGMGVSEHSNSPQFSAEEGVRGAAAEQKKQTEGGEGIDGGGGQAPRAGGGGGMVLNIAMEYMEGGSLAKLIEDFGPLPEAAVASYARQMVLGLEYLHALGVVHADIKPANCLLDKNGLLKLSDFGCAQRLVRHSPSSPHPQSQPSSNGGGRNTGGAGGEEEEGGGLGLQVQSSRAQLDELNDERLSDGASAALGALVCVERGAADKVATVKYETPEGTPSYMPPEVIRYREYSDKSDVWALGLTILECLTGVKSYPYSNAQTTLFQVGMGATPHVPAWLGREARNVICSCLQPNPRDRPTAAALLSHPFLSRAGRGAIGTGGAGTYSVRGSPPAGVRAAEVPTALLQLLASLNAHVEGGGGSEVHGCVRQSEWGQVGAGSTWRGGVRVEGETVSDFATQVRARKATTATIEELEEGGDLEKKDAMRGEECNGTKRCPESSKHPITQKGGGRGGGSPIVE